MARTEYEHAEAARRILADETFAHLCKELDDEFVRRWRMAETLEEREKFHSQQEALGVVVRQLETYASRHQPAV